MNKGKKDSHPFAVGDRVKVRQDGVWYPGVVRRRLGVLYEVLLDDQTAVTIDYDEAGVWQDLKKEKP